MNYLVLHCSRYDFKPDNSERVEGCKVTYLDLSFIQGNDERGFFPLTVNADPDMFGKLPQLPAVCELSFGKRRGQKGRGVDVLVDAKPLRLVNLEKFTAEQPKQA